jgi:hypothetical protein
MSNKESVMTDEDGYKKIVDNISSSFVMIGEELINPSFIISITKCQDIMFNDYVSEREPYQKIIGHVDYDRGIYVIDES